MITCSIQDNIEIIIDRETQTQSSIYKDHPLNYVDKKIEDSINLTLISFKNKYNNETFEKFIHSSIDEFQMSYPNLELKAKNYFE